MNRIRRRRLAGFGAALRLPVRVGYRTGRWAAVALLAAVAVSPSLAGPGPEAKAASGPGSSRFEPEWSWPLSPAPTVQRFFQPPAQRWLPGHRGVDLPAEPGTAVLSPEAGTVVFAGWVVNRPVLTVDLGSGVLASFEPVQAVKADGTKVSEGEVIGHVGAPAEPGHCPASCLHWGVRVHGNYVNPLNYVTDRRPSILLPLE
ncbi:M23 family metallopeptidase [Arthrobacter jiangjiafuii]|uniref:M23 family metallopeptidase n=1 Tax=Arthrobacter jiangjiafuii TaxID=2817475 RepID=A0A975R1Y8_9MICC|nr:M23 family metallopeptidase [Arthrobacter jiangjiafuii]MBP3044057.1 M23 family metallopeptidase [Arthrobacter jiangjiafuii]QWC11043.1 M23 family metallopeptidase [Arthrobacter jiangjiafuii]